MSVSLQMLPHPRELASSSVIAVDRLRKQYGGVPVVDEVSFQVAPGEIFGLLGPNGAGKTTTVECIQGLRRADGGTVRVLGLDPWRDSRTLRRRIGSQLQESSLPERITVEEALSFFARRGCQWRGLLGDWGLAEKRKTAFANLSGGQRQRLFVALAILNDPEVVFLDEMTTGLDPSARHVAWDLIEAIRRRGTTVVLVTHFMEEAERLCDRVGIMHRGLLVALGSPEALIGEHAGEVRVRFSYPGAIEWLTQVPHVRAVSRRRERVEVVGEGPVVAHAAAALLAHGIEADDIKIERSTLEDVFLKLTGESHEAA